MSPASRSEENAGPSRWRQTVPVRYGSVTVKRTEQEEQERAPRNAASNDFAPVSIKLRPVGDSSIAIVAEDAEGNYRGITVDEHILPSLRRVLAIGRTRLLDYWRTYDSERGGDYMLWDICRLCRAITRCTEVPTLKRLVKCDGAYNVMHNAYQAELIAEASERFPGAVRIASAQKDMKHGDFEIAGNPWRRFEVKTIHRIATIELYDAGVALDPDFAEFLPRRLQRLQQDAIQQVGGEGTLIAVLWCDSAGEIVRQVLADREVSIERVLVVGGVILGLRDATGKDRWFHLTRDLNEVIPNGFRDNLCDFVGRNTKISLTASFKCVSNMQSWTALGRQVMINNRTTQTDYDDNEWREYDSRSLCKVSTQELRTVKDILREAKCERERFLSLSENQKAERRMSYREVFSDDRCMCAFRWAGIVGLAVDMLAKSAGIGAIGRAIGNDIDRITDTLSACKRMLCGATPSKALADRIVRLVSVENKTIPVRVLQRLTNGLVRLVDEGLAARSD